jgi:hypothetical protein
MNEQPSPQGRGLYFRLRVPDVQPKIRVTIRLRSKQEVDA